MNKTSKKRAFFVVLTLCLVYLSVGLKVTDLFTMRRVSADHAGPLSPMNIYAGSLQSDKTSAKRPQDGGEYIGQSSEPPSSPEKTQEPPPTYVPAVGLQTDQSRGVEAPKASVGDKGRHAVAPVLGASDGLAVEPSMLIVLPAICLALKEGRIDKEGLIFTKKDAYNTGSWKKPLDILRDRDEQGIKVLLHSIGKDFFLEVLRKEGIPTKPDVSPEQLMTGKGYTVDKKKLLSLYHRHVAEGYNDLFPFMLPSVGVIKTKAGFELVESPRAARPAAKEEEEWLMPNLANLPLRTAVEKLAAHTSKIKVYGSGVVIEQFPRPFERLRGESECSVQGRLYSQ